MTDLHPDSVMTSAAAAELDVMRIENESLRSELDRIELRHQALLQEMGARAKAAAIEHDWCGVARDLVEDLGGIWPATIYRVTVNRSWTVEVQSTDSDHDMDAIALCLAEQPDGSPAITGSEWSSSTVISDAGLTVDDYYIA